MIKDIELKEKYAYAAGLLDGEGTILISCNKQLDKLHYYLAVSITNTNLDVINWLHENFGGTVCAQNSPTIKWKRAYRWHLYAEEDTQLFLEKMYKYLIIKRKQTQIAFSFLHKEYFEDGSRYFEEMKAANQKGQNNNGNTINDRETEISHTESMPE